MKVLITGANGLLGVNLARDLSQANMAVKAFVRPSANLKGLQEIPLQLIRGDLFSYEDVSKALDDCDAIVHAASTTSVAPVRFDYYRKINVEATKNIVRAVLNQGKRLIYVSTANAFGPGPKENPGTETSPFSLRHYHSGYINSKFMAQQHVLQTVEKQNLDAVVVNPTFIIGAYDSKPSSGKIILQGLKRGVQWCPPGGKNFVHARDVVQGIHRSLTLGKKGECYLLTGENLTYKEFFSQLNKVASRSRVQITIPKLAVYAAGAVAEAWNRLNDKKLVFNKTNAHLLSLENYYCGDKAKRAFQLESTPVQHAIEEALAWFKKENFVSPDNYSIQGTNFAL